MTSGSGATMVYDEANRISSAAETSGGIEYYGYSGDNKRFYKYTSAGTEQLTFYGARGEKLGVYTITNSMGLALCPSATNIWFAGKLILESNQATLQDRLGTNRSGFISAGAPYISTTSERFYPYGDEITSTLNDHEKFATYTRDSYTGFDYADQRYYASTYGRFNTADPYRGSARARNPLTWNRYSYVGGDPINRSDPRGLVWYYNGDGQWCSDVSGVCSDIDCTENPTACADALGEDDEGFGGGGGSAYLTDTFISTEITTTEDNSGPDGPDSFMLGLGGGSGGGSGGTGGGSSIISTLFNPRGIAESAKQAFCGMAAPLTTMSQGIGRTVGAGVGGSAGAGFILGIAASVGIQVVADRNANVGIAINIGGNPGYGVFGAGALGGLQASVSTASSIQGLKGSSLGAGGTIGPFGGDIAASGSGVTGTFTVGAGAGTKGAGLSLNYTFLPISVDCK
jgi:RHS repeat-associated protein